MSDAKIKSAARASNSSAAALAAIGVIATTMSTVAAAPETIQAEVNKIRKLKIKMGTVKQSCSLALKFKATFDAAKTASGKSLSAATRDNYLAEVRKSINEGTKFCFNTAREKARAKVAATKAAARPADASATPTPTPTATTSATSAPATPTPTTPASATSATPTATPSTPVTPLVPTLSIVKPNSITQPAHAQREIGKALCAVRAACTQETWNQVMVLNPALAKLVAMWGDTWTPAPEAKPAAAAPAAKPAAAAPAAKPAAPKKRKAA
jgi:hypothetical protein